MKTHTKKNQQIIDEKRLEDAKVDFNTLMAQIEPFIKKSDIVLTSTEGKWYDTNETLEKIVLQNSIYH